MTRTAILFSGSAYNVKFSLPSIMENLVLPNNADVFILTERRCLRRKVSEGPIPDISEWEKWEFKNRGQIADLDHPLTDEELQLMRDTFGDRLKALHLIEDIPGYTAYLEDERRKMMNIVNEYKHQNEAMGIKPPYPFFIDHVDNGNLRCVVNQFRQIMKCYEFMCAYEIENGFKYDYVMRARIDFVVPEKISIEYYTLNHDKAYWYIMGSVLRDPFPYAEEFCWFSKRRICEQIYPELWRMGMNADRKYDTWYPPQNNDFRFGSETQFALLIKELNIPHIVVRIYRSTRYTNGGDGYDYMNYEFRRDMLDAEYEFQLACKCESDINEHLPKLREYAEKCEHITECGTRYGNSSVAFMRAYPKKFISYECQHNDKIDYLKMLAKDCGINAEFKTDNFVEIEIEETDLLFIDTNHNKEQCEIELRMHSDKARKYIIFHDTETFWNRGQGWWEEMGHGLKDAIEPFLENNKDKWKIAERFTNNNGLMILERIK